MRKRAPHFEEVLQKALTGEVVDFHALIARHKL